MQVHGVAATGHDDMPGGELGGQPGLDRVSSSITGEVMRVASGRDKGHPSGVILVFRVALKDHNIRIPDPDGY